jgi:hypothetical protein
VSLFFRMSNLIPKSYWSELKWFTNYGGDFNLLYCRPVQNITHFMLPRLFWGIPPHNWWSRSWEIFVSPFCTTLLGRKLSNLVALLLINCVTYLLQSTYNDAHPPPPKKNTTLPLSMHMLSFSNVYLQHKSKLTRLRFL